MNFQTAEQGAELAQRVIDGSEVAISEALSLCEGTTPVAARQSLLVEVWPHTGRAATVGITGPPGVGKSTLTNGLIGHLRKQNHSVGVIAVDPSSPFHGGALLGDRARMSEHAGDGGVFIRSMSSGQRHLGGVAKTSFLATAILDAAGKDIVLLETVGVGQSETDIRFITDSVIVVLQPDSGDYVQTLKTGLLEIPDILCLNKSNSPAAVETRHHLRSLVRPSGPRYVETEARTGEGIAELWQAVENHRAELGPQGLLRRRHENLSRQVINLTMSSADMLEKAQTEAIELLPEIFER